MFVELEGFQTINEIRNALKGNQAGVVVIKKQKSFIVLEGGRQIEDFLKMFN